MERGLALQARSAAVCTSQHLFFTYLTLSTNTHMHHIETSAPCSLPPPRPRARPQEPKACSVVLRGASKDVLNEVERNLHDAMGVARNVCIGRPVGLGGTLGCLGRFGLEALVAGC